MSNYFFANLASALAVVGSRIFSHQMLHVESATPHRMEEPA
jgi:hypothetical protein